MKAKLTKQAKAIQLMKSNRMNSAERSQVPSRFQSKSRVGVGSGSAQVTLCHGPAPLKNGTCQTLEDVKLIMLYKGFGIALAHGQVELTGKLQGLKSYKGDMEGLVLIF